MVLVYFYHLFCSNVVINTFFSEAKGVEKVANYLLSPIHYLCEGKEVIYNQNTGKYLLKQRFDYHEAKLLRTPFALTFFPPSLALGGGLKYLSLCLGNAKERHEKLKRELISTKVECNIPYYLSLGLEVNDYKLGEKLLPQGYARREKDKENLKPEKSALAEILRLLHKHQIPCWLDCGSCLGAYRYGGVIPWDYDLDMSVLASDFENVKHALNELDQKKYAVQDWSNRNRPQTYLRVYVKETRNHIDIYHNAIDPQSRLISYIISNEESNFLLEEWKIRERACAKPISFETVFPLKKGEFDGIEVPLPNDTETYLKSKYGPNIEPARLFDEKTGIYEKDLSHPYWKIPLTN